MRVFCSGYCREKWVCPAGHIAEEYSPGGRLAEVGRFRPIDRTREGSARNVHRGFPGA